MKKITEEESHYRHIENMSVQEILIAINKEDHTVPLAVQKVIPSLVPMVECIAEKMKSGGRLFYVGAGTSGRLGIVDASECPPTYGVEHGKVIALIAGGDQAIRKAVEFAEDDMHAGWNDLSRFGIQQSDFIIGIAASGTTPYTVGALMHCQKNGITTGCITCNPGSPITRYSTYPIEVVVGPEFITGSTRMKSGTAQKLILNMISTSVMIKLGRILDNKMVDMQLSNEKLIDRGTRILMSNTGITDYEKARTLLLHHGSVRKATEAYLKNIL